MAVTIQRGIRIRFLRGRHKGETATIVKVMTRTVAIRPQNRRSGDITTLKRDYVAHNCEEV